MASGTAEKRVIEIPAELSKALAGGVAKRVEKLITPEMGEALKQYWDGSCKAKLFARINKHYGTTIARSTFYDYARRNGIYNPDI